MAQNYFILTETIERNKEPAGYRVVGLFARHMQAYAAMNALYQKQLTDIIRDTEEGQDRVDATHFCIGKNDAFIRPGPDNYYWEIVEARVITYIEEAGTLWKEK